MGDNNFKKLKSELPSLKEIKCSENIDILACPPRIVPTPKLV